MGAKTKNKKKNLGGRPTKYSTKNNIIAYKLCLLGATDKEIADIFEIDVATLNRWKKEHRRFCESLKKGKLQADAIIAEKLFHRAKGYSHRALKFATYEGKISDEKTYIEHYPPDTTAAIFWLKNRQPQKWRDRQNIEHSGEVIEKIQYVPVKSVKK